MTNAFQWNTGQPSLRAQDRDARPTKKGKSWSEVAQKTVARETKKRGRNPGTISGLERKRRGAA